MISEKEQQEFREYVEKISPYILCKQISKNRWKVYFRDLDFRKKYDPRWIEYAKKEKLIGLVKRTKEWEIGWGYAPLPIDQFKFHFEDFDWMFDYQDVAIFNHVIRKLLNENPLPKYMKRKVATY